MMNWFQSAVSPPYAAPWRASPPSPSIAANSLGRGRGRIFQAAAFDTAASNRSSARSHWLLSGKRIAAAGTVLFSVAAAALVGDVEAKESVQLKFRPDEVVLYQYEACPFCNKVKAFLDYYDIAYKVVEVNPISKNEIKWSDYKIVPILMVDGEQLVDSSGIGVGYRKGRLKGASNEADLLLKYCSWVDYHLVHLLSPNIYRNSSEALESFDYITSHGNFSFTEKITAKYAGAAAMYFVSKKLKKKLIRYLKSGRDMVEHTRIGDWYSRMETAVEPSSRIQA
ncbi:Glutathione S-transferase family protein [Striga hermonthica]|uniref:Glutathione S-transferase family protein n=1 Tax=Striga hermonthica TaxID=68872 RepID=A0A9N7R5A2_STRHE|nr:Glutathione S-transferase family protein [Striga hermonthica]